MNTRRSLVLTPIAVAALLGIGTVRPAFAQESTPVASAGNGTQIVVTATGEAQADATGGIVQFIVRAQPDPNAAASNQSGAPAQATPVTDAQVSAVVSALEANDIKAANI